MYIIFASPSVSSGSRRREVRPCLLACALLSYGIMYHEMMLLSYYIMLCVYIYIYYVLYIVLHVYKLLQPTIAYIVCIIYFIEYDLAVMCLPFGRAGMCRTVPPRDIRDKTFEFNINIVLILTSLLILLLIFY